MVERTGVGRYKDLRADRAECPDEQSLPDLVRYTSSRRIPNSCQLLYRT